MTAIDHHEEPDSADPEVDAVVEEAAPEYPDLNPQRRFRVIIYAIGIVGLLLMGWQSISAATSGNEIDSLRNRNEQLTNTNQSQQLLIDKLATQLDEAIDQGADVPEPEVIAAEVPDAEVSPVETVAPGVPGERGDAGPAGETGSTGSVGSPGSVGEQGSIGPRGLPGADGTDGAPGADGASVQGPPGPAGTDGAPGANGTPGQPGADGAPGGQGPPGPMPSTFTCTPTNPLDLGEPWTCTTTS